jgi:hypothetical protein
VALTGWTCAQTTLPSGSDALGHAVPVLKARCLPCHGGAAKLSGLGPID